MPLIQVGERILYGTPEVKPILPEGFKYIERPGHWLFAEGPNEKLYYVSWEKLYRMRLATWWDVVKTWVRTWGANAFSEGDMFLDNRETIYIAHLQTNEIERTTT